MRRLAFTAVAVAIALLAGGAPAFAQTNIILTSMSPPGNDFSTGFFGPWAERMNAASKGTLHVEVRDGYAVANYGNVYDRVMDDVVQIGWGMQGIIAGRFPLTEVATFPFEADNAEQASVALSRLYKAGAFGDEYKDVKPLVLGTFPMNGVHYAKAGDHRELQWPQGPGGQQAASRMDRTPGRRADFDAARRPLPSASAQHDRRDPAGLVDLRSDQAGRRDEFPRRRGLRHVDHHAVYVAT